MYLLNQQTSQAGNFDITKLNRLNLLFCGTVELYMRIRYSLLCIYAFGHESAEEERREMGYGWGTLKDARDEE